MKIQIIQVPYDSGYRDLRQGCGPAHFIDQNLAGVLEADGHQILTTRLDAKSKFTTEIGTAFELNRLLSGEVNAAVGSGLFPLVLAGNCNSCLGTIAGIDPVKLGVVWFDAHIEAAIAMVKQNFNLKAGTVASFDPTFDSNGRYLEAGIRCIRQMVSELEG